MEEFGGKFEVNNALMNSLKKIGKGKNVSPVSPIKEKKAIGIKNIPNPAHGKTIGKIKDFGSKMKIAFMEALKKSA